MGPMMPQYQPYAQNWYPYQNHVPPHHTGRHAYYPQHPHVYPSPQLSQQQSPINVSSQPHSHASSRPAHPTQYPSTQGSTTASTSLASHLQSTSSPAINVVDGAGVKRPVTPPSAPIAAGARANDVIHIEPNSKPEPFFPPVPWLSVQDQPFPPRATRRHRQRAQPSLRTEPITFPLVDDIILPHVENLASEKSTENTSKETPTTVTDPAGISTLNLSDTPVDKIPSHATVQQSAIISGSNLQDNGTANSKTMRAAVPIVPIVPLVPTSPVAKRSHRDSTISASSQMDENLKLIDAQAQGSHTEARNDVNDLDVNANVPPPPPPTSWAALLRSKNITDAATTSGGRSLAVANGFNTSVHESLGDVLNEINVNEEPSKLSFLQPRGLINTGNMCYMNSVLQMLVFCIPFYEFLDKVAKRAPHTFKSDTPLIDAMIMFMREYPSIDSTSTVEQLRLRLKPEDYERYGEPFVPEYVYNIIKQLPKFRDMRRGHQQDAQEFLGFLLEELHEECANAMRLGTASNSGRSTPVNGGSNLSESQENGEGWMEVGHKQKAAITRSSGAIVTESPVTNIFGGKLRSELKVAGNKLSVTLEPYQPLQLDIGSTQVNNILDALKGLTRPESMQGDFQSARGLKTSATKQVFIETLPPVLILHLKRFHYDSTTKRVEKIWKKIGYPLELEMPKEVFPTSARNKYAAHGGLPKYRLIGVIYHHGKNASGGHYTVDIRRQDCREWIRVDDTVIRRVRSEDVAEGGSEEDPRILADALEQHKQGRENGNRFEQIEGEEDASEPEKAWNQVNGHTRSKSTMSALLNGSSTPAQANSGNQTPRDRFSHKDNKVAYLLFYQRILS